LHDAVPYQEHRRSAEAASHEDGRSTAITPDDHEPWGVLSDLKRGVSLRQRTTRVKREVVRDDTVRLGQQDRIILGQFGRE
jgi:hypothetical protein